MITEVNYSLLHDPDAITTKEARFAQRLARRMLRAQQDHAKPHIIKGGLFGLEATFHNQNTYSRMAQLLLKQSMNLRVERLSLAISSNANPDEHEMYPVVDLAFTTLTDTDFDPTAYDCKVDIGGEVTHHYLLDRIFPVSK